MPEQVLVPGTPVTLPWPKVGQARIEVDGLGLLGNSARQQAAPIASVTKVMTALVILRDHPLSDGQEGPIIRVTRAEAGSYARRKLAGESLIKVRAGPTLTERQALQGLLIASGNNAADILGRWDAGSTAAFVKKMNVAAGGLGLSRTHYADTSGLNAHSRSDPLDLIRLARVAMRDATFASIVRTKRASIPFNRLKNTNRLLGAHGVVGIKTGSTRAAGGCLVFAAHRIVGRHTYSIYGAVLGAPGPRILGHAFSSGNALIVAAGKALRTRTLLPAGTVMARVTHADGTTDNLILGQPLTVIGWPGQSYTLSLPPGLAAGEDPTMVTARTGTQVVTSPLVADPVS